MKRYDKELYDVLERIDEVDLDRFGGKHPTNVNICFYNETRKRVNSERNHQREDSVFIPTATDDDYTQDAYLHEGVPIISRRTDKSKGVVNNEQLTVGTTGKDYIELIGNSIVIKEDVSTFHHNFALAYCVTTHKIQGTTINERFTIHDWGNMPTELKYTALSRGTKCDDIQIERGGLSVHLIGISKKLKSYESQDKLKGRAFDLSADYVKQLIKESNGCCHHCSEGVTNRGGSQWTLDRVDSQKGHATGNIVVSCLKCNRARKERRLT
jgi:hypothetical protein